jgi:hypothetical protein
MRTPVPKCLDMKRNWWGTGIEGRRLTMIGKEQAVISQRWAQVQGGSRRTSCAQGQNEQQGEDMQRRIVVPLAALGLALWPSIGVLLSTEQLGMEDVGRDV